MFPGIEVWQIGNEGGFLAAPVDLTAATEQLLLAPAERADVIVDFNAVPAGNYVVGTRTRRAVRWWRARRGLRPLGPRQYRTGSAVHEWCRRRRSSVTATAVPAPSRSPPLPAATVPARSRSRGDVDVLPGCPGKRARHGRAATETAGRDEALWTDPITENPAVGATEVWEIDNTTADAHPMHVHEVVFEVVDRQRSRFDRDGEPVRSLRVPRDPATGTVGERIQGHRDRLPRRSHPHQGQVRASRATSSGTATSSSTRTTR